MRKVKFKNIYNLCVSLFLRLTEELKETEPEKKVLLMVFSSTVSVKGGGREDNLPNFTEGIDRKNFEELLAVGLNLHNEYPLKDIQESHE